MTTHRANGRRPQFICICCPGETWSVAPGQTIIEAQSAHMSTHSLALRVALDELIRDAGGKTAK